MRHLKSYKIFEAIDDLVESLQDICLDLEDDGFEVLVNRVLIPNDQRKALTSDKSQFIRVRIANNNTFYYREILDTVDRMTMFMGQNGCKRDESFNVTGVIGIYTPRTKFVSYDQSADARCDIYYKL